MQTHLDRQAGATPDRPGRGNRSATSGFADRRPESATQAQLQDLARTSPQATQLEAMQARADASPGVAALQRVESLQGAAREGDAVVQRKALIDGEPAWDATGVQYPPGSKDLQVVNPSKEKKEAIDDDYVRHYADRAEFDNHLGKQPVDVGLVKDKALWYDLPFSGGFFVLGEAHNVLSYQTIIGESNQTGKILGEGGSVPFDHYAEDAATRKGKTPMIKTHGADEFAMESPAAKAAYALASLGADIDKELLGSVAATSSGSDVKEFNFEKWNEIYQKVTTKNGRNGRKPPAVGRDDTKRPYFEFRNFKVTLQPDVKSKESGYSRNGTAQRVVKELCNALESWQGKQKPRDQGIDDLIKDLNTLLGEFTNWEQRPNNEKKDVRDGSLAQMIDAVAKLARKEIKDSKITRGSKSGDDLISEQHGHNKTKAKDTELAKTCTLRDVFMYEAIVNASQDGFLMAGVGNDHLRNLEKPLKDAGIKTISHSTFFKSHVKDAI
ncbi:MAG: hypothetical protein H6R10_3523 [Rhodocyclaceae bacterium]|nr:hypothetical protein [Rhodocyclaceae bacterium]